MPDPFTASPELAAIARRWLQVYSTRQAAAASNLFSASDAVSYIGSAEGEIWTGRELRDTFADYTAAHPPLLPENIEATGFEAGDFGYAYTTLTIHAPEAGLRVDCRNTFVFALEDGVWRIVHVHNSIPKPNTEAMGYLSRHLDELAAAATAKTLAIAQTGTVSVMFTDIVDSTALAAAMGDAAWGKVVRAHLDDVKEAVTAAGGTLVKTLGDGTLSTFGSAGGAMRAAIAIQTATAARSGEPRLQMRVGIHTGDTLQAEGDPVGTVVNKAARIAAIAAPGEIVVSDAARVMVGATPGLTLDDGEPVSLKGLPGEHRVHRLHWQG